MPTTREQNFAKLTALDPNPTEALLPPRPTTATYELNEHHANDTTHGLAPCIMICGVMTPAPDRREGGSWSRHLLGQEYPRSCEVEESEGEQHQGPVACINWC